MLRSLHPRLRDCERGAAALEFSLIAVILFTLIFGIIEFGLFFSRYQIITGAAREGARTASTRGTEGAVYDRIVEAAGPFGNEIPPPGSVSTLVYDEGNGVVATACSETTPGGKVVVEWDQDFTDAISLPFIPAIDITRTMRGVFRCE